MVERLLAKEEVASSNLVFRSNKNSKGDVAKWQGRGLQNLYHRFDSGRRLHIFPGAVNDKRHLLLGKERSAPQGLESGADSAVPRKG